MPFFKNCEFWKMWFLKFFWGPRGSSSEKNLLKNGFIGSVTPIIKKSLPFESQKIVFKMIYRHFTLGGASDAPPPGIDRVKVLSLFVLVKTLVGPKNNFFEI